MLSGTFSEKQTLPFYEGSGAKPPVTWEKLRSKLSPSFQPLAHPKERRNAVHKATERTTAQRNPLPQASASSLQRDEMMWPRDSHSLGNTCSKRP